MRLSERLKAERAYVESKLIGVICHRCGATLATMNICPADLDVPCPGFCAIDAAKTEFNRNYRPTPQARDE